MVDTIKNLAATFFWWLVLVLDTFCFALLVTVLPCRLRNGAGLRAASSLLVKAAGISVEVGGLQNVIRGRSQVFAVNHESWFDSFVLGAVLPVPITFVSKKEMFRVPIYSYIIRRLRFVCVDRANPRDALKNIDATVALLRSGLSVVVYPEGTTKKTEKLGSFKRGAVLLAAKAGVPIVPIAVIGTSKVKTRGSLWIHFGISTRVIISEPVEVGDVGKKEQRAVVERLRAIIEEGLTEGGRHQASNEMGLPKE